VKVSEIMTQNVVSITVEGTLEDAAKLLLERNISGLPVVDKDGKLAGIITHKDLLYKNMHPDTPAMLEILGGFVYLGGVDRYNNELKKLVSTKVSDLMTADVITAGVDDTVQSVAKLMVNNGVNRIPIVKDGQLVGIVSRADIVRSMV